MSLKCHWVNVAGEEPVHREGRSAARFPVRLHVVKAPWHGHAGAQAGEGSWPFAARWSFRLHRETGPWAPWWRVCPLLPGDTGLHARLGVHARPADCSQMLPASPASAPHARPPSVPPLASQRGGLCRSLVTAVFPVGCH